MIPLNGSIVFAGREVLRIAPFQASSPKLNRENEERSGVKGSEKSEPFLFGRIWKPSHWGKLKKLPVADNIPDQNFEAEAPYRMWVTAIKTWAVLSLPGWRDPTSGGRPDPSFPFSIKIFDLNQLHCSNSPIQLHSRIMNFNQRWVDLAISFDCVIPEAYSWKIDNIFRLMARFDAKADVS